MTNQENSTERGPLKPGSTIGGARIHPQDLEIRKFAVEKAVVATTDIELLDGEEDYGKLIVDIAATIEDYLKNGKKEETK